MLRDGVSRPEGKALARGRERGIPVPVTPARLASVLALLPAATACVLVPAPVHYEAPRFESAPRPAAAEGLPNWPLPPERMEALLGEGHFLRVESLGPTQGGATGAQVAQLFFPDSDEELRLKVKWVPGSLDGFNNSPRKELAAYAAQRLFLDPVDYVVPYTRVGCPRITTYRQLYRKRVAPQVPGSRCMLALSALWLRDVTVPEVLYDQERFLTDPTYARYLADWNLFTYLVDHRDGRPGNFLVSQDDDARMVFSVDNGISFGPRAYNVFRHHWNTIRVAALRRESVDRLRALERRDLDFLRVVKQLELQRDGVLRPVAPGPPLGDEGVTQADGAVQFGLTQAEIDDVWGRIEAVIADVDAGRIPVF